MYFQLSCITYIDDLRFWDSDLQIFATICKINFELARRIGLTPGSNQVSCSSFLNVSRVQSQIDLRTNLRKCQLFAAILIFGRECVCTLLPTNRFYDDSSNADISNED
jgi:hypothetical protein